VYTITECCQIAYMRERMLCECKTYNGGPRWIDREAEGGDDRGRTAVSLLQGA